MQEFGAAAAGATAEVMALEQSNSQAAADRFIGHAASTGATADNDEVKTLISHSSEGSCSQHRSNVGASVGVAPWFVGAQTRWSLGCDLALGL